MVKKKNKNFGGVEKFFLKKRKVSVLRLRGILMKIKKEDLNRLYETLGVVSLIGGSIMNEDDQLEISNLVENIIDVFNRYKDDENEDIR